MADIFGLIHFIPEINRQVILSSKININNNEFYHVFPISKSIVLSSNLDFICSLNSDNKTLVMLETWNSLLLEPQKFNIVDKLSNDYLETFNRFILFSFSSLKLPEKQLVTGPPITSNNDIRLQFQKSEHEIFNKIRNSSSKLIINNFTSPEKI